MDQPALILADPDPETGEPGFLTMADVFELRLNADMVILSACNSGMGEIEQGEGIISLTRSFMYAGAPAVAVNLWSVLSSQTKGLSSSSKVLATGFFRNLKEDMPHAEALRQIKLRMIRSQEKTKGLDTGELYRHPFFWAPMVFFGEGQ